MSIVRLASLESSGSPPSIGDLLNFLTVVFFGLHMLRTEHIWRNTNRNNFLPLLGYKMAAMCDVLATETAIIYGLSQSGVLDLHGFFLVKGWGLLLCLVKCSAPGSYSLWKPKGAYIWIIFSVVSGKYEKRSEKGDHLLVSDE
ncbi:hypothetical protein NC652_021432 [Populus alba x Populus x berolinensis]|nr:hypothetical protein NC652_021432 [Populus alba x Populus x berolinensis]